MIIQSKRLVIVPTTIEDFYNAVYKPYLFEEKYHYPFPKSAYYSEKNFHNVGSKLLKTVQNEEKNFFWYLPWLIMLKAFQEPLGIINFKGPISTTKDVKVGYGIEPQFRQKGYAGEALQAIISWVIREYNVERIFAETENSNQISQHLLQKTGFRLYRQNDKLTIWVFTNNQI